MDFPWLKSELRPEAQSAIESSFEFRFVLSSILEQLPEKSLRALIYDLTESADHEIHDVKGRRLAKRLESDEPLQLRIDAARELEMLCTIPDQYHDINHVLSHLKTRHLDERSWVKAYTKITCKSHLARSYSKLFHENLYNKFCPDFYDSELTADENEARRHECNGLDLKDAAEALENFAKLVIGKLHPEINDYGYRLCNYLLGCESFDLVVEKARRRQSLSKQNLLALSPRDFERLIGELLLEFGFEVELTQASRDGGIDLFCARKKGDSSESMIVECKRYQDHVGVQLVRQFVGANAEWNADKMVFVALSGYTKDARAFAMVPTNETALSLLCGDAIIEWIKDPSINKQWNSISLP